MEEKKNFSWSNSSIQSFYIMYKYYTNSVFPNSKKA